MTVFLLLATPAVPDERDTINLEFARSMAAANLRDSHSARFLDVHYVTDELICGSVNAKNGHGGYTGWVQFAVWAEPNVTDLDPIVATDHKLLFSNVLIGYDERMRAAVSELCKE